MKLKRSFPTSSSTRNPYWLTCGDTYVRKPSGSVEKRTSGVLSVSDRYFSSLSLSWCSNLLPVTIIDERLEQAFFSVKCHRDHVLDDRDFPAVACGKDPLGIIDILAKIHNRAAARLLRADVLVANVCQEGLLCRTNHCKGCRIRIDDSECLGIDNDNPDLNGSEKRLEIFFVFCERIFEKKTIRDVNNAPPEPFYRPIPDNSICIYQGAEGCFVRGYKRIYFPGCMGTGSQSSAGYGTFVRRPKER